MSIDYSINVAGGCDSSIPRRFLFLRALRLICGGILRRVYPRLPCQVVSFVYHRQLA